MSLTSLIRDRPDIRKFLVSLLDDKLSPGRTRNQDRINRVNYLQVGTGFDYLFRFEVLRKYSNAKERYWIAELGYDIISSSASREMREWTKPARKTIEAAKRIRDAYYSKPNEKNLHNLADVCLRLYHLDRVYRSGEVPIYDVSRNGLMPDPFEEDVNAVIELLERSQTFISSPYFLGQHSIFLNPNFGPYSSLIGGADADIITPSILVDLKTSNSPRIDAYNRAQIVGYYLLLKMNNANILKMPKDKITKLPDAREVGIFYPHIGELYNLSVDKIRCDKDTMLEFIDMVNAEPEFKRDPLQQLRRIGFARSTYLSRLSINSVEALAKVKSPSMLAQNVEGINMAKLVITAMDFLNHTFRIREGIGKKAVIDQFSFEDEVYLDIETTGLWSDSIVWLIGAYSRNNGRLLQLFAPRPEDEKKILREYLNFITKVKGKVVIFSGNEFDKRFINDRLRAQKLSLPKKIPEFVDLLTTIRETLLIPSKNGLKEMGAWMGYKFRHPDLSGGQMPVLYEEYLTSKDKNLLKRLYEYNEDDIKSLMYVMDYIRNNLPKI